MPGHHADRISDADFRAVLAALPGPADLMLEAKEKDLALFALRGEGAALRSGSGEEVAASA